MARRNYTLTEPLVPLEPLLKWKHYEYGKCKIHFRYGYQEKYGIRHLLTNHITYTDTEEDAVAVLDAAYQYENEPFEMPDVKLLIIQKVRQLTASYHTFDINQLSKKEG